MARTVSPLRYPGGKTCLAEMVSYILKLNKLERGHYVEPFAGGAGLALTLLYGGEVSDIHINDIDPAIYAFWFSVLNHNRDFLDMITYTPVNMHEWHRQREIFLQQDIGDPLSLGFSAFFLNRTNRSGIIKGAGVIGGLSQEGNYKIDCRFNKEDLISRIERVFKYKDRINLTNEDASSYIKNKSLLFDEKVLFCIDPPYYNKGSSLYTSFYDAEDHQKLSEAVMGIKCPWIVTYDFVPEIQNLYKKRRQFGFDINYSVQKKRIGKELLILSKKLRMPESLGLEPVELCA